MAESKKDLKYFMRDNSDEIVTVPGPDTFKDENGNVIQLQIKALSQAEIDDLNDKYRTKGIATDKKGNPLISRGEVVWKTERDSVHATQMMIVKALVYPNLADPDLMDYYHCVDVTEMPRKVFSRPAEYTTVLKAVMEVCGIIDKDDEKATLEEAKN